MLFMSITLVSDATNVEL